MASLREEILNLLATHAGQPVDGVAIFMLLNTVAGGHYQERYGEAEIARGLDELLAAGAIESLPGENVRHYRLISAPPPPRDNI